MNLPLGIKDPVFAAYLFSLGIRPGEIEPSIKGERAKEYMYEKAVADLKIDEPFLGVKVPMSRVTWRDFVMWMDRFNRWEDNFLRQHTKRAYDVGVIVFNDVAAFETTVHSIAAFVTSLMPKIDCYCMAAQPLGPGRGYRFIFSEGKAVNAAYREVQEGAYLHTTWAQAKDAYKHATMLHRAINRKIEEDGSQVRGPEL